MQIQTNAQISRLLEINRFQAGSLVLGVCDGKLFQYFKKPISGMIKIDYPLDNPDIVDITDAANIGELLWDIAQGYKRIYNEENETATEKVIEKTERIGLMNRNRTNGVHGIWGHDIEDLVIEGIVIANGEIKLLIGS